MEKLSKYKKYKSQSMITSGVHVHSFNLKLCNTPVFTRKILSILKVLFESILEVQIENKKSSNIACN